MHALTERQAQVYQLIQRSIRERGIPPSLRELGAELGIASTNGVTDHLHALERKGWIRLLRGLEYRHTRGIQLVSSEPVDLSDLTPDEREKVVLFVAGLRVARSAA